MKTVAGQEDVPIQLIEQAPGRILDQVLMTDLTADYNQRVDQQVIVGNGTGAPLSGGQVVGIYPATNWGATNQPWNPTTPPGAPAQFFQMLGTLASKVSYSRFNLQNFHYLLHPRRGFWFLTSLDGANNASGRPLVEGTLGGPFNTAAMEQANVPAEGFVASLPFGPNLYVDANVPTTDNGAGSLSGLGDVAIGALWDDLWLFEGDLRARVLTEVLSGTLELRFQVYGYIAFLQRYGVSVALGSGTGLGSALTGPGAGAPVLADGSATAY